MVFIRQTTQTQTIENWDTFFAENKLIFKARLKKYIRTYGTTDYYNLFEIMSCWMQEVSGGLISYDNRKNIFRNILTQENGFFRETSWVCRKCKTTFLTNPLDICHTYYDHDEYDQKSIIGYECTPSKKRSFLKNDYVKLLWSVNKASPKIKPNWWQFEDEMIKKDAIVQCGSYEPLDMNELDKLLYGWNEGIISMSLLKRCNMETLAEFCHLRGWTDIFINKRKNTEQKYKRKKSTIVKLIKTRLESAQINS